MRSVIDRQLYNTNGSTITTSNMELIGDSSTGVKKSSESPFQVEAKRFFAMAKSKLLLTAMGATILAAAQPALALGPMQVNTQTEASSGEYQLRVLSNGYGYLTQDGHIYILYREVVGGYQAAQLPQLIAAGKAVICNQANCDRLNINTAGLQLLV